jgi:hypothetical protein
VTHATTQKTPKAEDRVKWLVDLRPLEGASVVLETRDGVKRSGRITRVVMQTFKLGRREISMPLAVELNGDPGDRIEFGNVARFDVS